MDMDAMNGRNIIPADAKDAAQRFASDESWRESFLAELDHQRKLIVAERDSTVAQANLQLKALESILPKPEPEPAGARPPGKLRKLPKVLTTTVADFHAKENAAVALAAIKLAGKDGIASRTLGKELGESAGPIVKPLIEAKKVRQKGTAGATRYYAL